jgi:hypothetical protein
VTLSIRGFISFVTPAAAPIATGWSEPVPGRDFHPLWISAFSRRTSKSAVVPCSYMFITDQLRSKIFRTERSLVFLNCASGVRLSILYHPFVAARYCGFNHGAEPVPKTRSIHRMAACNVAKDKAVTSYAVGNEAIARIPFPRSIECTHQKTVSHELAPHWSRFSFRGFAYATPSGTLELHRQKNLPSAALQFLTYEARSVPQPEHDFCQRVCGRFAFWLVTRRSPSYLRWSLPERSALIVFVAWAKNFRVGLLFWSCDQNPA